jgi:hypothetical protein
VGEESNPCTDGQEHCANFSSGTKFFALYGYNGLGLYSFGVAADSTGRVRGEGDIPGDAGGGSGGGNDGGGTRPDQGPAITIAASPLEGISPVTVRFMANATSTNNIDESRTQWDFDISDGVLVDATTRNTSHTYSVAQGEVRTFVAQLRMFDVQGNAGSAQVAIQVTGLRARDTGPVSGGDFNILVGTPNNPAANLSEGISPLQVVLSVEADSLPGVLQSIAWDLGDGSRSTSLTVPHTYVNQSETPLRVPITATITSLTSGGTNVSSTATKLLTIRPGDEAVDPGEPDLPGTGPTPGDGGGGSTCGAVGLIPLLAMFTTLTLIRRRRIAE